MDETMTLYFIQHSCYLVEGSNAFYLFDYFGEGDPSGRHIWAYLSRDLGAREGAMMPCTSIFLKGWGNPIIRRSVRKSVR